MRYLDVAEKRISSGLVDERGHHHGLPGTGLPRHHSETGPEGQRDVVDHPDLRAKVQEAIDDVNSSVSRAESIRAFAILPHDFSVDDGELTPTMKVRRAIVAKHYDGLIDGIYAS